MRVRRLHDRAAAIAADDDVDVVWFGRRRDAAAVDATLEATLVARVPAVRWSVKNQARMHARNGHAPYASTADALRHWPETATAVAVRAHHDAIDVLAPFGLGDLFSMTLRPPPDSPPATRAAFAARVHAKRWLERWPLVRLAEPAP